MLDTQAYINLLNRDSKNYSTCETGKLKTVDGPHQRDVHSVSFRSGTLPSGLYFYRIDSDAGTIQRKMILAR